MQTSKVRKIMTITNIIYPTEKESIIFQHFGEYKNRDYLIAVNFILQSPKEIIAASRVSNNRFINYIFLSSKEATSKALQQKGFQIGEKFVIVTIKRDKPTSTKFVLSNLSPNILNTVLQS